MPFDFLHSAAIASTFMIIIGSATIFCGRPGSGPVFVHCLFKSAALCDRLEAGLSLLGFIALFRSAAFCDRLESGFDPAVLDES